MDAASVEKKTIDHTFIDCSFTETFIQKVIYWFNTTNKSQISPTQQRGNVFSGNSYDNSVTRKFYHLSHALSHLYW